MNPDKRICLTLLDDGCKLEVWECEDGNIYTEIYRHAPGKKPEWQLIQDSTINRKGSN